MMRYIDAIIHKILLTFKGVVVGLEETVYTVYDDVGAVEMCSVVISPNIACPSEVPFNVVLSTSDGSAGIPIIPVT